MASEMDQVSDNHNIAPSIMEPEASEDLSSSDGSCVRLKVGSSAEHVTVHVEHLFKVSPVFKAAFTSRFQESASHEMCLPDEEPKTVDHFVNWLYNIVLPEIQPLRGCSGSHLEPDRVITKVSKVSKSIKLPDYSIENLCKLYVFAEKYQVSALSDAIMSKFRQFKQTCEKKYFPPVPCVRYLFENTPTRCDIRALFVIWFMATRISQVKKHCWTGSIPDFAYGVKVAEMANETPKELQVVQDTTIKVKDGCKVTIMHKENTGGNGKWVEMVRLGSRC